MSRLNEINQEIEALKNELENVEGTETEIYARIVGYYRSVKNWNRGKKEEYKFRKDFSTDLKQTKNRKEEIKIQTEADEKSVPISSKKKEAPIQDGYLYFYRNSCPNCPPVKNYLRSLPEEVLEINVDTAEGLRMAADFDVMATPTAIWLNADGTELFRGSSVKNLKKAIDTAC